jgi:TM2 domain-containing membrane protein YozV
MLNPMYTASMSDQQRTWFYAEYEAAAKNEVVGVLLALFLGSFGIHKFYMGETGWGVLYLLFSWTGIPAIAGFIECFLMPGRIRAYNAAQAQMIASGILASNAPGYAQAAPPPPGPAQGFSPSAPPPPVAPATSLTPQMCPACGAAVQSGASFCAKCGNSMATVA